MSEEQRRAFAEGVRALAPILLGIVPFGVVFGIAAANAGLRPDETIGMSVVVFAGAAQLAAVDLLRHDAALIVVIATALTINARHVMYSASIAPHLRELRPSQKAASGYLLTDQAFAFSISAYRDHPGWEPAEKLAYLIGSGITLWGTWQLSTVAGLLAGNGIPERWALDFSIPLVFLALLAPAVRSRSDGTAALVAAVLAVTTAGLPYNLGLIIAALAGIAAGVLSEKRVPE